MNYLSIEGIAKSFGERVLFENITFGIEQGQKAALVAKNGSGKTTLMRLVYFDLFPDTGHVMVNGFFSNKISIVGNFSISKSSFISPFSK